MLQSAEQATDETGLVRAAQAGDVAALERLIRRQVRPVRARIQARIPAPDVDDVLQDVLLAAVVAVPTYHAQSAFGTWLLAIAAHKIADYYRQDHREPPCGLLRRARSNRDCRSLAEHHVLADQVLVKLSPRMQAVLVLRLAEERSFADVAERMCVSEDAAKSLYRRAVGKCRSVGADPS
jgi:RNA polymerase sigma-70 factor (ECF subfamily)